MRFLTFTTFLLGSIVVSLSTAQSTAHDDDIDVEKHLDFVATKFTLAVAHVCRYDTLANVKERYLAGTLLII